MSGPTVVNGLEELRTLVGLEVGQSDWFTVTQDLMDRFAEVSGDQQWIHVDVERAAHELPQGKTIAHGFLTVSLLSKLSREAVELRGDYKMRINYGFNRLRFVSPVPAGSRIRARFKVQSVQEDGVTWSVIMDIEGSEKPALVAEWLAKLY